MKPGLIKRKFYAKKECLYGNASQEKSRSKNANTKSYAILVLPENKTFWKTARSNFSYKELISGKLKLQ